ncbi:MAG: SBBP repeat-containing protein, partial [Edaphocola sp.]
MKRSTFLLLFVGMVGVPAFGKTETPTGGGHISFIENKGQWPAEAKYKADVAGGAMFLTDGGFVYNFVKEKDWEAIHEKSCSLEKHDHAAASSGSDIVHYHAYKVNFVGAQKPAYSVGDKRANYNNYFIGNDQSKWAGHVGLYGKVSQKNIYPGIDLVVYASGGNNGAKYDFIVAPGADPSDIAFSFDGVAPQLDAKGNLVIKTTVNEVTEQAPVCFQNIGGKQVAVKSAYKLKDGVLRFSFPDGYNKAYALTIDPTLVFATYSGATGTSAYFAHSTTFDKDGNTYTAALAGGSDWPTTTGAYMTTMPVSYSSAINKYSPDGSTLVYSTYFGGTSNDCLPNTLRVNDDNELFMAGNVLATDMPVTTGAFQTSLKGSSDIYLVHFSADGSSLLGSTYLGGTSYEASQIGYTSVYSGLGYTSNPVEIMFDASGNVWLTSNSASTDFPVTSNSLQTTNAGSHDVVIAKMTDDFSSLLYSTYLGGSGWDGGIDIELNEENQMLYIVGCTGSANFPVSSGSFQSSYYGNADGFVATINPSTYAAGPATYLGTSGADQAQRVAFDCSGNVFVAGRANSGNYPVVNAQFSVGNGLIFVQKLNQSLTTGIASTRIGSTNASIACPAMVIDVCGNILVATIAPATAQTGMPLTQDAFMTTPTPFWFCAITSDFGQQTFGSFYGASADHYHCGVARMDAAGIVYASVCTSGGSVYPTTSWAYSPTKQNSTTNDNVTFKFSFDAVNIALNTAGSAGGHDTAQHCIRGCKSAYVTFNRIGSVDSAMTIHYLLSGDAVNGVDYQYITDSIIIPVGLSSAVLEIKPLLISGTSPNGYVEAIIQALSPCGCGDAGQDNVVAETHVKIYDSLYAAVLNDPITVCPLTEVSITAQIDSTLDY